MFAGTLVPDLGLAGDPNDEFRVYVLASGDKYYVGVEERRFLKQRLLKQIEQRGAHWNKVYKADGVAYAMPVKNRTAEAYVYFALLAQLPSKSIDKLGGWTQTSTNLSPLSKLLCQEARRNVTGACFTCGSSSHFSYECKSAPQVAHYVCRRCSHVIAVTARGQTPAGPTASAAPTAPAAPAAPAAPSAAPAVSPLIATIEAPVGPQTKRSRVSRASSCLRVRVCGVAYTTWAWYLGDTNPNRHQRQKVTQGCMDKAVEIDGGDAKTLQSQALAEVPRGLGKELLRGRVSLPHDWVASVCSSSRLVECKGRAGAQKVRLRKATAGNRTSCRGVLWRLEDLERALCVS